jgi:hypothetical protein
MDINKIIGETLGMVNGAFPSLYTKEDVTQLLNILRSELLEAEKNKTEVITLHPEDIEYIKERITESVISSLQEDADNFIEYGTEEFNLEYNNQIVLESVALNYSRIGDLLHIKIEEVLSKNKN